MPRRGRPYPGLSRREKGKGRAKRHRGGTTDDRFIGGYTGAKIDPGPAPVREMSGKSELSHHVVVNPRPERPSHEQVVSEVIGKAMHGDDSAPLHQRSITRVGAKIRMRETRR